MDILNLHAIIRLIYSLDFPKFVTNLLSLLSSKPIWTIILNLDEVSRELYNIPSFFMMTNFDSLSVTKENMSTRHVIKNEKMMYWNMAQQHSHNVLGWDINIRRNHKISEHIMIIMTNEKNSCNHIYQHMK